MIETDGPYGNNYQCYATNHTHHIDEMDSIYWNTVYQGKFYHKLVEMGVYSNQPDTYYYWGGSKSGK